MTTAINVNRQTVLSAKREFSFDDFAAGVATMALYLKPGTRVLRGFVDVTTAFNAGTLSVGDTEGDTPDADKYLVATDVTVAGLTEFSLTPLADGVVDTAEAMTLSCSVTPSAGAGVLYVEYVEEARVTEYHTYRG